MTAVSPPSIEERLQALAAVIHQASCASVLLKAPWDQLAQSPLTCCLIPRPCLPPPADCVLIQNLCREWAYGMPFQNSEERNQWLPGDLSIHNPLRKHSALSGRNRASPLAQKAKAAGHPNISTDS